MIDLIVQRGGGDKPGDDIVEPLAATVPVALARGTAEINTTSEGQQPVTLLVTFKPGRRLGRMVEVHDSLQGRSYRGKITDISHRIDNGEVTTSLTVLKGGEVF